MQGMGGNVYKVKKMQGMGDKACELKEQTDWHVRTRHTQV
jgi:hypothetical protein